MVVHEGAPTARYCTSYVALATTFQFNVAPDEVIPEAASPVGTETTQPAPVVKFTDALYAEEVLVQLLLTCASYCVEEVNPLNVVEFVLAATVVHEGAPTTRY